MKRCLALLIASTVSLVAADPVDIPATQLCREANFHEVRLTTTTGDVVEGFCLRSDVNQIALRVHGKPVTVQRNTVSKVLVLSGQHQLRSLGGNIRDGLHWGFRSLLSPSMVVGMVAIPATLAWGAVSAPFCIMGDLVARGTPDREVQLH